MRYIYKIQSAEHVLRPVSLISRLATCIYSDIFYLSIPAARITRIKKHVELRKKIEKGREEELCIKGSIRRENCLTLIAHPKKKKKQNKNGYLLYRILQQEQPYSLYIKYSQYIYIFLLFRLCDVHIKPCGCETI